MNDRGPALYWLDHGGGAPPLGISALGVKSELPAPAASEGPAVAFVVTPASAAETASREVRQRLGEQAYIILVTKQRDDRAIALIGRVIDDLCSPDDVAAEAAVLLARAVARANERHHAVLALATTQRRYEQIQSGLDTLPTPIFIKDASLRYVGCNKAFERFLGLSSQEIIGKGVYEVAPPELAKRYEDADRRLLAEGGAQIYEAKVRYADGSHHDVVFHKANYKDRDGAIAGMAGVILDINKRKRAETALLESEQRYRDVFENASDSIALIDVTAEGRFTLSAANPAARRACGLAEPNGDEPFVEVALSPTAGAEFIERLSGCVASRTTARYETLFKGPLGIRTLVVNLVPVTDTEGAVRRIIAIARDVTDEREVERLRVEREREFRTLVDNSPDSIVRYDRSCRRLFSNRTMERRRNLDPAALLGKTPVEAELLGDHEQEQAYQNWLLSVMEKGAPDETQITYVRADGERRIGTVRAIPEHDSQGKVVSILTIGADTHDRISAERKLRQRELEFRTLVENSPDLIVRYDTELRRRYVNPVARKYLGAENVALGGTPAGGPVLKAEDYVAKLREVLALGVENEMECAFRAHDGSVKWSHVRFVPEFDEDEQVVGVLSIGRDISEIVESRRKIQHLAFYDSLTGLPNRSLLRERIAEIASRPDGGGAFALMLLDLDRFKEVNDTFGHAVGDALLCKVAARLRRCVRGTDTISRLGGDEFAILLPNPSHDRDLSAIAAKILRVLSRRFFLAGREIMVLASIGVAECDASQRDIDTLFKHADSAMYHAKRMGRNNFQFFTPEMMARNVWRMAVETNLRRAIPRGELAIYFQPRVDLATRAILGAEALLRWRHDELGFLTPDKFLGVAEESGQIVEIGRWVLAEACRRAVEWNKDADKLTRISVNLSSRQFVMNDLVGSLRDLLRTYGCAPQWLELEITESLLLEDNKTIFSMLEAIREMGVAVAVDDFGTGFSALSYLTRFPLSALKVDRSVVQNVDRDRKRGELLKAVVGISRAFELKLVAEGVENEAQADFLLRAGCTEAQGFLFGGPTPEAKFVELLRAEDSRAGYNRKLRTGTSA
jgi:diguanylate cyclase (GGDEF)-like protein/PAS domain S-box-containing protein